MTGDLHEISAAIGELRADNEGAKRSRAKVWAKLDKIDSSLTVLRTLPDRVEVLEKIAARHEKIVQRGIGAYLISAALIGALGLLGGAASYFGLRWTMGGQ